MKIEWRNCDYSFCDLIEKSMNFIDRTMLDMRYSSWNVVADDIADCLKYAKNGQFRNVVGFIDETPAVFVMFGVENSGEILRIYNLFVEPEFRGIGVGKQVVRDILDEKNIFGLDITFNKLVTSIYCDNRASYNLFSDMGLRCTENVNNILEMERGL